MRRTRLLTVFALAVVAVIAAVGFAGEPIPDVDVILEQIPPGLVIEVPNGAPFDRLTLGGSRELVGGLEPERLPAGWVMRREGRRVVLAGPVVSGPTRIALRGGKSGTKTVDWDVSLGGRELARQKNVVPRSVPRRVVKNSLQGVVVMPEKVSPGEAVALRPLPGANLPPGRFVLSGVVMEPVPEEADSGSSTPNMASAKTARTALEEKIVSAPRDGFVLTGPAGTSCAELLPLAAVLVGAGASGGCTGCKSFYESRSNTANRAPGEAVPAPVPVAATTPGATQKSFYESRSNTANRAPKTRVQGLGIADVDAPGGLASWDVVELRARPSAPMGTQQAQTAPRHESAKNAIRNMKALCAVAPSGGGPDGAGDVLDQKGLWEFTPPGGAPERLRLRSRRPATVERFVAMEWTETPSGCLVTGREPDLFDLAAAMQAQKPRHDRPEGKPERPVTTATATAAMEPPATGSPLAVGLVPEEAVPGTTLSLQYVDIFGDLVVDVPAVPGTEVVPPPAEAAPPCVTAATAFAQPEDTVCVCGHFPGAAAQAALWLDERAAGEPVSLSSRTLQLQLPTHGRTPGRHVWSGDPEAGFAPACRAWTQVVQIAGELDSQRLFSGQSTPMRLTVSGTTERVPIRIRNLSPAIVTIDGGAEQTVESTGGTPNTVTRPVRGLVRGNFDIEWSLATDRCPCP